MTAAPADLWWRSAEGLRLHALDYPAAGDRLPVICLHGLTRNARDFDMLGPWLAEHGRRAITVDVRGRGQSAWDPEANYRLPAYADDAVRLCASLGIERAIFVGTSMGGLITMVLAGTHPDLVAAAVINDVGPELAVAGLTRIASYTGKAAPVDDWADAAAYVRWQNEQALPHYTDADWAAMARRMFREANGRPVADYDPGIARAFADGASPADPWGSWEDLADGRPVLLLRGLLSDLLDPDVAAKMAERRGVRFTAVPGVGHAPMLDEPAALAAIEDFLATLP
jgi:pimeloyl-ACP methyl ester carboxylesterase